MPQQDRKLTDMMSADALQEIQDGFSAITGLSALIVDHDNHPITAPSNCDRIAVYHNHRPDDPSLADEIDRVINAPITIPIAIDGTRYGGIVLNQPDSLPASDCNLQDIHVLASSFNIPPDRLEDFANAIQNGLPSRRAGAVQFLYLLADAITQICRQDIALRQRVQEMSALYQLSSLLAGKGELQDVLDTVTRTVAQVTGAKAASIRLLDDAGKELIPQAVYNLSQQYLDKGPILLANSRIDREAFENKIVYVADMATDPRTLYPNDARREGLASILVAPMVYHGRNIGAMRIYTAEPHIFSDFEKNLLQALAQLSAAAIENVRLRAARREAQRIQHQVQVAVDVQRRMMPTRSSTFGPFDIAGRYEPCFELGGDFFDLITTGRSINLVVGDVVGKGVPASLLMASVRASLRAHAEDVYDLDQIMAKVNRSLCRDTTDNEFATVFYGSLDSQNLRLTYCSAGHDPALLLRNGRFTPLQTGGMVLGVDPYQVYAKGIIDLQPNDILLVYTDGVTDAMNFDHRRFTRDRVQKSLLDAAPQDAQSIVNHVLWEARRFIGLNPPTDDMTLLAIKVRPRN